MNENRGSLYLLTGLALGIIIGLLYAWWVRPVQYTNTKPSSLRADFKNQYRALIAAAYLGNPDLVRAKARLTLLKDPDLYQAVAGQAQRTLAEGSSVQEARALGLLAVALGQVPGDTASQSKTQTIAVASVTLTSILPSAASPSEELLSPTWTIAAPSTSAATLTPPSLPTATAEQAQQGTASPPEPTATQGAAAVTAATTAAQLPITTPRPTSQPSSTPGAPFALIEREMTCDPDRPGPRIEVLVQDAAGQPVSGVGITVSWDGTENTFFTGLKPEMGTGYADFNMALDKTYTLRIGSGGQPVTGLAPASCTNGSAGDYWGAWQLVFAQP